MILLDTHIWVHWMNQKRLSVPQQEAIANAQSTGIGISAISCWEIAMLTSRGRLTLNADPLQWMDDALTHPAVVLLPLTPRIGVESTQLPDLEHKDPADRMIIATARVHDCPLLTDDGIILGYPHVQTIG